MEIVSAKKMIKYPSTEQFRNVISNINRSYNYIGQDEDGNPIYDQTLPKPNVKFTGTVKIHGTNAGVSFNTVAGLWAQSRENIITPEKDNAGFALFVHSKKSILEEFIYELAVNNNIDLAYNTVTIYGEWAGGNIQKGVGICNLEKSFFPFGVKVSPIEDEAAAYWLEDYGTIISKDDRIYDIREFEMFEIDIDFNYPELSQNTLQELTLRVEEHCPVAKLFGFEGVGEGIVWTTFMNGNRLTFKTKGEKHSSSKVKTVASIDVDKINSIKEFVEYAVTDSRFNQALENVFPNNSEVDIKKLGDVIRWVVNDVIKEETDTLIKNGLEPKEVNPNISAKVREKFFKLV